MHDVIDVSLLEPYVSDGSSTFKLLPFIKVDGEEEYIVKKIIQSAYRYNALCNRVKYNGYSAKESKWLPVENLRNVQDMVRRFHMIHPN